MFEGCECARDRPDWIKNKVDLLAENLSVDLIAVILEENLCPAMGEVLISKAIAALSARLYLLRIGKVESEKLRDVDLLHLPATRAVLDRVYAGSKLVMENDIARS
jgi:hypothetical protein